MKKKIFDWIGENKVEFVVLIAILLVGAFLRLYMISGYMTFLGDEGRDAVIVRRLLVNFDPILIGPGTSIGNMYLGPLYYYLIAPALFLANFSPAGPSIFVAILGVGTIFLVWYMTREFFSKSAAIVAASLYAVSPTTIIYSRSSWNPNVMPFFATLCILAIWKVWQAKKFDRLTGIWFLVLGGSLAMVLQSHYLGLLLVPVLGFYWLLTFYRIYQGKERGGRVFWKYSFMGLALFLFLMSPLIIFDFRHGFINSKALEIFFTQRQTTVSARPWNAIPTIWPLWEQITASMLTAKIDQLAIVVAIFLILGSLWLYKTKESYRKPLGLIFLWLFWAILGMGLYKQHIYDHYFGFVFAPFFMLFGAIFGELLEFKNEVVRTALISGTIVIFGVNLINTPINLTPNRQMERTMEIARKIEMEAGGEKFNLAIIAERNYEDAYQYFLEMWGTGVIDIDPLNTDATIAKYLFVVCEYAEKEKCDPTHSPKAEVANFGWSEIIDEWNIWGMTIYKLGHVVQK